MRAKVHSEHGHTLRSNVNVEQISCLENGNQIVIDILIISTNVSSANTVFG
jgi:hypothetical protein